jgi:cell division protein FtsB
LIMQDCPDRKLTRADKEQILDTEMELHKEVAKLRREVAKLREEVKEAKRGRVVYVNSNP